MAFSRFLIWLFSSWHETTVPLGMWVMRAAEYVVLTLWPLGPEQRRLLAARAGPDLEQHVLLVVRVLGEQEVGDLLVERVAARLLRPELFVGHLPQLRIGLRAHQLLDLRDLAERRLVGAIA